MSFLNTDALLAALGNLDGTTDHVLTRLAGGKVAWVAAPGAAGGEANTASNQGAGGVGVFKQKTSVDLEFKNINAGSSKITITDDTGNDEIDIDAAEANFTLDNLGGTLAISKGGTGQTAQTAAFDALGPGTTKGDVIVHNGTDHIRLGVGTDTHVLTADSAEASGVKWAAASGSGGALTLLENTAADQSTTSTSLVDVTGFTFAVSANTNYVFQAHIGVTTAGSTSGVGFGINGPSGMAVYVQAVMEHSTTAKFSGQTRTLNGAITSTNGSATEYPCKVWAILRVGGTAGTAALRFRSETGNNTTVKQNSYGWYSEV